MPSYKSICNCQRTFHEHIFCAHANIGGGERVRTDDPLRARQVLSQLSYTPNNVVGLDGLEPSTSRLSVVCSSQLSYRPLFGFDFVRLAALASSSVRHRSLRYASSPHPCRLASQTNPNPHSVWPAFLTGPGPAVIANHDSLDCKERKTSKDRGLGLSKLNSRLSTGLT